jgi:hypothetical protein
VEWAGDVGWVLIESARRLWCCELSFNAQIKTRFIIVSVYIMQVLLRGRSHFTNTK